MKCPEYSDLSRFYDGEVEEAEKMTVESHLNQCEGCSALLSGFRSVEGLVESLEPLPGKKRIEFGKRRRARSVFWKVATLAALVMVMFFFYPSSSRTVPPDSATRTYEFASKDAEYTVVVEGEAQLLSLEMGDVKVIYENE